MIRCDLKVHFRLRNNSNSSSGENLNNSLDNDKSKGDDTVSVEIDGR